MVPVSVLVVWNTEGSKFRGRSYASQFDPFVPSAQLVHALYKQVNVFVHGGLLCSDGISGKSGRHLLHSLAAELWNRLPGDAIESSHHIKHGCLGEVLQILGV